MGAKEGEAGSGPRKRATNDAVKPSSTCAMAVFASTPRPVSRIAVSGLLAIRVSSNAAIASAGSAPSCTVYASRCEQ